MNVLAAAEVIRTGNAERIGSCKTASMMEDPQTPGSDCNSNPASDTQDLINSEFIQDNMDYQWFIDYRDGGLHVHPSILSSLSASYTKDDLGYYDDLARNLDANLAEVDMENFRTADIHTLLTALPVMCTDPVQHSEGEDSACSTADTISICKSSLLFSPVKETPVLPPGASYSVDSLDCEDMLITCQTNNKNNYTIAFEGSMAMYSDGSQDFDNNHQEKQNRANESKESLYKKRLNFRNMLNASMACSDSKVFTTWSNIKHSPVAKTITRHPSGNNNTLPNLMHSNENVVFNKSKSQSLPDLAKSKGIESIEMPLNFSLDSAECSSRSGKLQSSTSMMSRSTNDESSDSVGNTLSNKKLQNMSLLKLFMKQKSMSTEGMSLTLDQGDSESENGWPTSATDSGTNTNTQIQKQNTIHNNSLVQGNDLAIKWVKADNAIKNSFNIPKLSLCSNSLEDVSATKLSHDTEKLQKREVISKTTGVQARAEVEDNGVQTSMAYVPLNANEKNASKEEAKPKPIYIIYPNYVLPDLSFLKSAENKFDNVSLKPQGYGKLCNKTGRPFSCNDVDAVKQRGFSHVKDWESLTFLLPTEYKKILHNVPEASKHIKIGEEMKKPLFCLSPPMRYRKRTLNDILSTNISSSSSTATQPSSGYRGSSTILSDSSSNQQNSSNNQGNPLYLYRYDSVSSEASLIGQEKSNSNRQTSQRTPCAKAPFLLPQGEGTAPPRPPLPRSILRKNRMVSANKRFSMFEMGQTNPGEDKQCQENKRISLQEPYYMNNDLQILRNGGIIDSEKDIDEAEEKQCIERLKGLENEELESSSEEIRQLEEFLRRSGLSSQSSDDSSDLETDIKLRSCVRRFLALKMNQDMSKLMDMADSQKKTVSFAVSGKQKYMEEKLKAFEKRECSSSNENSLTNLELKPKDLEAKKKMIWSVNKSVDVLLKFWHGEPIRRQGYNDKNECSQLCLSNLCPTLYAIMSDGLKPNLNSTFGPIANSVWQVVEASSQQGPLTKTLNDLVQKINSEDLMTEGMFKFHAFVFGLLNLRALDAWFAYLCTRESILRKHYNANSLFVGALSCANTREAVDAFLNILQPLAFCPFQLDLLYQYRQLHNSFGQGSQINLEKLEANPTNVNGKKARPRSCILYESSNYDEEKRSDNIESKKRWSHIPLSAKFHMYDQLEDSEDYTDSLEHVSVNKSSPKRSMPLKYQKFPESKFKKQDEAKSELIQGEVKFRRLQEKWENIGRDENIKDQTTLTSPTSPIRNPPNFCKSKIPRLLTSPVKAPSNSPIPSSKAIKSQSGIPTAKKPIVNLSGNKTLPKKNDSRCKDSPRRTSRVDQENIGAPRSHLTRPSSLPYNKTYSGNIKDKNTISPQRRAASTSLPRPHSIGGLKTIQQKQTPKVVRTLNNKTQSADGHLAFLEGDYLKVILEVDSKFLLCSKGEQKGLVSRNCVRAIQT